MKELQEQYSALCQRLGDAIYKKSIIESEISELQAQLKALNVLNAMQASKKSADDVLKDFIEKRKKESGASSVSVADSVPGLPG